MVDWLDRRSTRCKSHENRREELIRSLKVTLKESLGFNQQEAIQSAAPEHTEEPLTI